jgi:hypothetical protein
MRGVSRLLDLLGAGSEGERLRRKLFTLLAAISLVFCVAALGVWMHSMGREDRIVHYDGKRVFSAHLSFGALDVSLMPHTCAYWEYPKHVLGWQRGSRPFQLSDHNPPMRRHYGVTGFNAGTDPYFLYLPLWMICLAGAVLPAVAVAQRLRRPRAVDEGRCVKCGYDLRASPERCPECGAFPAAKANA